MQPLTANRDGNLEASFSEHAQGMQSGSHVGHDDHGFLVLDDNYVPISADYDQYKLNVALINLNN